MKKRAILILIVFCLSINFNTFSSEKITKGSKTVSYAIPEEKIYTIPLNQRKKSYSVLDFKKFYYEYLRLNKINLETSPENDKTEMKKEDQLKYYTIYDITPKNVKGEIGCQVFKVNYTCESYVIYKSKIFHIGFGFGGFGIVSLTTCDFDGNGQKDLIYTYSWGSGLHRSLIGIFDFSKEKEQQLDFSQLNKDIMIDKISNNNFKIYIAGISSANSDFTHFKLSKKEFVGDIKTINKKIKVTTYKK